MSTMVFFMAICIRMLRVCHLRILPVQYNTDRTKNSPQCTILSNPGKNSPDSLVTLMGMLHRIKINKAHKIAGQ